MSKKFLKLIAPGDQPRTFICVHPHRTIAIRTASSCDRVAVAGVDFDAELAEMLGIERDARSIEDMDAAVAEFDDVVVGAAVTVLAQLEVTMRTTFASDVADVVAGVFEHATELAGLPRSAVGAAAPLVDHVRDTDHAAIAWTLLDAELTHGADAVLRAFAALRAAFTLHLAATLLLDVDAVHREFAAVTTARLRRAHRAFCRSHRPPRRTG